MRQSLQQNILHWLLKQFFCCKLTVKKCSIDTSPFYSLFIWHWCQHSTLGLMQNFTPKSRIWPASPNVKITKRFSNKLQCGNMLRRSLCLLVAVATNWWPAVAEQKACTPNWIVRERAPIWSPLRIKRKMILCTLCVGKLYMPGDLWLIFGHVIVLCLDEFDIFSVAQMAR